MKVIVQFQQLNLTYSNFEYIRIVKLMLKVAIHDHISRQNFNIKNLMSKF